LLSSANQAAFVKVYTIIWTQDLKGRQPLDSSMRSTFFQELLLGNPKDFGPWDFFMEPGSSLTRRRKKSPTLSALGLLDPVL
jgi:hypothetical protein